MVKIFVEGGGDAASQKAECRQGFSKFFKSAGFKGNMPRTIPCGSRNNAFDSFKTAINNGECAFLLVDSEEAIAEKRQEGEPEQWKPWAHLQQRDKWKKPERATEQQCHLMVQCMEAWFLADRETLNNFFGQGFNVNALPAKDRKIESVSKHDVYQALADATKSCKTKAKYSKRDHSFKILERIAPDRVMAASPWAKRLIDLMKEKSGC